MADIIKTVEAEITRKEILMLLKTAVPVGCSKEVLDSALAKEGLSTRHINDALYYLTEKELIKCRNVDNRVLGIHREIYSLTAKGIDYLEGNGDDIPGVGI